MRPVELMEGITVTDSSGEVACQSKVAAREGIAKVSFSSETNYIKIVFFPGRVFPYSNSSSGDVFPSIHHGENGDKVLV